MVIQGRAVAAIAVVVALLVYTVGLAVGPRLSAESLDEVSPTGARVHCLTAIDLPGPFGILLNCDSPEFMEAASNPRRLLEHNNVRQSRPGQIWLAWVISKPLSVFASALGSLDRPARLDLISSSSRPATCLPK